MIRGEFSRTGSGFNKKRELKDILFGLFFFTLIALFFAALSVNFVFAQTSNNSVKTINSNGSGVVFSNSDEESFDVEDYDPELIKDKTQEKWDYLQKEWKSIILKNPSMAKIDSFFSKFNIIFVILFGEGYSISLMLLGVIILWVFTLIIIKDLVKAGLALNLWASYAIGLGGAVIIAQLGIIRVLLSAFLSFAFGQEFWWVRLIVIVFGIVIIIAIYYLFKIFDNYLKITMRNRAENEQKLNQEKLKRIVKGVEKSKES